jgi:hypothetical protein
MSHYQMIIGRTCLMSPCVMLSVCRYAIPLAIPDSYDTSVTLMIDVIRARDALAKQPHWLDYTRKT